MTRRELIWKAANTGGYGTAFLAMRSLDLLDQPPSESAPLPLVPNTGRGVKVAILGAGIAGLVATYEMRKAGFDSAWEQDDNIYGGISRLDTGPISLESGGALANVWYPSGGMLSGKGVLIAGYGTETGAFADRPTIEAS